MAVMADPSLSDTNLTQLCMITANRPDLLERSIASYMHHLDEYGRDYEVTVFDDSLKASVRRQNRALSQVIASRNAKIINYIGVEERMDFVERLGQIGIDPHTASFSLLNSHIATTSPGINRNTALLYYANRLFFSSDDDAICQPYDLRSGPQEVTALDQSAASLDFTLCHSKQQATLTKPRYFGDVFSFHEDLLRHEWVKPREDDDVIEKRPGTRRYTVGVSMSGVVGCSGIPHSRSFLIAHGILRDGFLEMWKAANSPQVSTNAVRGATHPAIDAYNFVFTTTMTGFNNRFLLPPFMPVGVGEDTLFGTLLSICSPSIVCGHVPVALIHSPPHSRTYRIPPVRLGLAAILNLLLSGYKSSASEPSSMLRYTAVGSYLKQLGALDMVAFEKYVGECTQTLLSMWVELARQRLQAYSELPTFWAEVMWEWISGLEQARDSLNVRARIHQLTTPYEKDFIRLLRTLTWRYGLLIEAWPDMASAATELQSTGRGLTMRLMNV